MDRKDPNEMYGQPEVTAVHHEENSGSDNDVAIIDEKEPFTWQQIGGVIAMMATFQGYLMTLVMPNAILSYINADLGPSPIFNWIPVGWNLAAAIFVSIGGRLSDIFGRRYFFLAAPAITAIGTLVGANGQSIGQMIAAGVIMGTGSGFGEMALGAVQEFVPYRLRTQVIAICDCANVFAGNGPLIAYVFIAKTNIQWRAVYWYGFAWQVITFVLVFFFYKPPSFKTKHSDDGKTKAQLVRQMDFIGLGLLISGTTLLLMGITWGGGAHPWKSAYVIAPLIVGVLLLVTLGLWTAFTTVEYPLFPRRLFVDWRKYAMSCAFVTIANSLYYAMGVIWPRQSGLLYVPADDTIMRGVYANMVSYGTIMGAVYASIFCPRLGSEKWQLVTYMSIQTALVGTMSTAGRNKHQAIALVLLITTVNIPMSVLNFAKVSLDLKDQMDIGIATGLLSTFRLTGGAIATAIYSSVQSSKFIEILPGKIETAALTSDFSGDLKGLLAAARLNTAAAYGKVAGATPEVVATVRRAVEDANIVSFRLVYLVGIAFGCIAITAALCQREVDPSVKTNARAVRMENEKEKVEDHPKAVGAA